MKRFIQGEDRTQIILLPECLEDYVSETNPVRVVDVFIDELDLGKLGFAGMDRAATGRPGYHPAVLLKIYLYGYLNRIQSSRRLQAEAQRNVELMADGTADARLQDHSKLPQRQRQSHTRRMPAIRHAVPATGPVIGSAGGH